MKDRQKSLFDAVRRGCSPATWSRGVELSRAGAVTAEGSTEDEAIFRISRRGGMLSRAVTLFLGDDDWECGCSSREASCEHVAAAVIAWRRADESGTRLPEAREGPGAVGYRFTRQDGALALERVIVQGQQTRRLEATLVAVTSHRVPGLSVVATQADLAVELALGTHRRGPLSRALVSRLFRRLAHCPDVQLDERAVRISNDPVLPHAFVEDQGEGFRLGVEDDPQVTEVFTNGIALCGETLRPLGDTPLTGRELHELPAGKHFGPSQVAELVSEVLPALSRRIPVEVRTTRLPATEVEAPRIRLEVARDGEILSVMATLVYGDPPRARVDGGRLVHLEGALPLRDEKSERRLLRRLQNELGLAPGVREAFPGEAAVAYKRRLDRWEGRIVGAGHEQFVLAPPLVPRLAAGPEGFDVSFDSEGDGDAAGGGVRRHGSADASDVLRRWQRGDSLVPLREGGWAPIPGDWLERFGHRVADLLAARGEDGALPRCSLPDLARLCEELDQPAPPEFESLKNLVDDFEGIPPAELPADLTATLRGYQRRGVDWLAFMGRAGLGAMLADDMGLGKTLQALCAIRGRTLVVAPTSVLHNWAQEIRRFRPALHCSVYHGPRRLLDPEADVTLTTYALLRLDAAMLGQPRWDTVILDEAQAIKNPDSQVAGAAFALKSDFRVTLTGTPVENRLDELWSQFHFINRGLLGGRRDFQERYAAPIADGEPGAAARLRERVRPFLLRRLKQEVAPELPPRTEMVLRCELTPGERDVYDAIRAATLEDVVKRLRTGGGVMVALEALLRMRQAACHSALIPGQQASGSSKLALLLESLDSIVAEGHKALVFSQWTSLLDLAEPHLDGAEIEFVRLDGSTRDRGGVVERFQSDDGPPVMLVSLKAGGTGLNLTAADHIFLLDPWWNPAVEDQAADRAHRIGQHKPVLIYRLVAAETVEERILTLQQRKREIADAALSGADRAAGITRDDLLELLG